jgi:hypothetical protein
MGCDIAVAVRGIGDPAKLVLDYYSANNTNSRGGRWPWANSVNHNVNRLVVACLTVGSGTGVANSRSVMTTRESGTLLQVSGSLPAGSAIIRTVS